jgi:hypothetical protein
MDERGRRIGENEALYRLVNERIESLNEAFGTFTGTITAVCECGDASCAAQIDIAVADYERVRAKATDFIVVPGHELADVEEVVEEHETFAVVRKRPGAPAHVARETDPRS